MAEECPHAVSGGDIPYPESFISARTDKQVSRRCCTRSSRGYEADRAHTVVMACEGSDILIVVCRVPKLNGQIGAAGCEKSAASGAAIIHIQHCSCVTLDGLFQLS